MAVNRSGTMQPGNYTICTFATRPASPYTGQMIYQTDTKDFYIYDGTGWVSVGSSDGDILTWTGL